MGAIVSFNLANAMTKLVAADALPALYEKLPETHLNKRYFEPRVAKPGDTVQAGGRLILLDWRVESKFQVPDITKVLAVPDLLHLYMSPAVEALGEHINARLDSVSFMFGTPQPPVPTILVTRRLPPPEKEGSLAEYAELGNFGMMVSTEYNPNSLSQEYKLGGLYGYGLDRLPRMRLGTPETTCLTQT